MKPSTLPKLNPDQMRSSRQIISDNEQFLNKYGADLQASIFTPHRFDHVLLLFLKLDEASDAARVETISLLRSLANNSDERKGLYLCSVAHQRRKNPGRQTEPDLFCNLYLTGQGLKRLGMGQKHWQAIIDHLDGTKTTVADLQHRDSWEVEYLDKVESVEAVLLLAHPKTDALIRKKEELEKEYFPRMGVQCLLSESGRAYRRRFDPQQQRGFAIEHFGYADGLSNPWVTRQDTLLKGIPRPRKRWDPTTSCKAFLVPEPGAEQCWGSYLVYRKYRQYPDRFATLAKQLAEATGKTVEVAGELLIGRRRNGSSLTFEPGSKMAEELSDFDFSSGQCPLFAHTRKVNGRDQPKGKLPKRPVYPILRRGITFGDRPTDPYRGGFAHFNDPGEPVGLLFMSFQNDIGTFQQLLRQSGGQPADPILGSLGKNNGENSDTMRLEIEGLDAPIEIPRDQSLISMLGGLNLYAPSISFFKNIRRPAVSASGTRSAERSAGGRSGTSPAATNSPTMESVNIFSIPIFGQDRYAFFYALKYYNDTKVGYDGAIAAYAIPAAYSVRLPDGPTVPVRDQRSLRVLMTGLQGMENNKEEALGLTFEVPLRKGYRANIDVTLSTWDGAQTLASHHVKNCYFNGPADKSPELMNAKPEDEYGFVRIALTHQEPDDLKRSDTFLQAKIEACRSEAPNDPNVPPVTKQLFLLRVTQFVWPANQITETVKTGDFECRDDSIILEIREDDDREGLMS